MNETLTTVGRRRLLQGDDSGHPYHVLVPLRCRTVEDALDWLRPRDVPGDALRQGEFYFVPSGGPHAAAGCDHGPRRGHCPECWYGKDRLGGTCLACSGSGYGPVVAVQIRESDCGSREDTPGGSSYRWTVTWHASFSRRHVATTCYSVVKSGDVAFRGRRRMRTHSFTGRPRYFVAGQVEHEQHGTLVLPKHWRETNRISWYEVVPNRAHGPFPTKGLGPED